MSFICGQNEKSLCARVENRVFYENTEKSARGWRTQLFKTPEFRALLRNRAQELVDKMKKTGRINVRPQSGRCISKLEVCMKKVVCLLLALVMLLGLVACASNTAPATEKTESTTTEETKTEETKTEEAAPAEETAST